MPASGQAPLSWRPDSAKAQSPVAGLGAGPGAVLPGKRCGANEVPPGSLATLRAAGFVVTTEPRASAIGLSPGLDSPGPSGRFGWKL